MQACGSGESLARMLFYSIAIRTGTGVQGTDNLCTIDADHECRTVCQAIHRLEMPGVGDMLHNLGWNAC
ncbi:MAG: hypothetical protein OXL68_19890 [Paracoccaceae bacterium]|nr:hypothetical protein [Paracoccaceae bacterium]